MTLDERLAAIAQGAFCAARFGGTWLHIKIQNQICGGKYVDQTRTTKTAVDKAGAYELKAQWQLVTKPRPQPPGRRQLNPRNNISTMLTYKRAT